MSETAFHSLTPFSLGPFSLGPFSLRPLQPGAYSSGLTTIFTLHSVVTRRAQQIEGVETAASSETAAG